MEQLLQIYDRENEEMIRGFLEHLDEEERDQVEPAVQHAKLTAATAWDLLRQGYAEPPELDGVAEIAWSPVEEAEINPDQLFAYPDADREIEWDEADTSNRAVEQAAGNNQDRAAQLQRRLSLLYDNTALRVLVDKFENEHDVPATTRMRHLRQKHTEHGWLWRINPEEGPVVPNEDFILAIQHRLGANILSDVVRCRVCGQILDVKCNHACNCAQSQATIGHYRAINELVSGFRLSDAGVQTEVRGLIPNSNRRPADVLTAAAVPGRFTALDINITSAHAAYAGRDAVTEGHNRKLEEYRNVIRYLHEQGIVFRPLVWSSEGLPHSTVPRVLAFAAQQASRKWEGVSAKELVKRWSINIAVAIQRRKAAMIRACIPTVVGRARWLLTAQWSEELLAERTRLLQADATAGAAAEARCDQTAGEDADNVPSDGAVCPICIHPLQDDAAAPTAALRCNHRFHMACLCDMLVHPATRQNPRCPYCRDPIQRSDVRMLRTSLPPAA